jgi:predicted HAD superfamily Cof-like phosphohydrolase
MNEATLSIREAMLIAKQECPDRPTIPSFEVRVLRAKLMLEECLEAIMDGLGLDLQIYNVPDHGLSVSLDDVASAISSTDSTWIETHPGNLTLIADGCADMKVVTIGTELACGIDGDPVLDEVNASNLSKFEGGVVWLPSGKYGKGPNYRPPNIVAIIDEQIYLSAKHDPAP